MRILAIPSNPLLFATLLFLVFKSKKIDAKTFASTQTFLLDIQCTFYMV